MFVALLLIGHTLQAQTTTWDGSESTAWADPLNWSAGVPGPAYLAIIPGGMPNQPTISVAGAVAKSVVVSSGGFLTIAAAGSLAVSGATTWGVDISGTVENNGTFSVNNITYAGILMRPGSLFTNKGSLQIGNTGDIGYSGISNSGGTFVNESGSITVDRTGTTPGSVAGIVNKASFTNQAVITIGGIANNLSYGLWNDGAAANFMNQAGGSITIDRIAEDGLLNQNSSSFTNQGSITIGAVGSIGFDGIENSATFNNSTCTALINVASNNIIKNTGTFSNAGFIIENASGNSSITSNTGVIQNLNGGTFTVGSGNAPITVAAGDIWTGCTSTDWDEPTNWFDGTVPTATDDVIIPDVTNDPVIMGGTAALANSVSVNAGASLTIDDLGSLTINGSSSHSGITAGLYNEGTVDNSGGIILGSTASVGQIGLWNFGTFNNNTGGETSIDRSIGTGLYNAFGTFTNAAKITLGAVASIGAYGILNSAAFNNNSGGEISIDWSNTIGLNNASGTFTNAAKITIGAVASIGVGTEGILNNATFNNNSGGEITIDRSSNTGLFNNGGTFTNAANITIGAINNTSPGTYGLQNGATFNNNSGGEIRIDRSGNLGLANGGTFNNAAKITIGATADVGVYGLSNGGTFNNNTGGEINIDRSTSIGIALWNTGGTFTNAAKITIGAVANVGDYGFRNEATFHNNSGGEFSIDQSNRTALWNFSGTFTNAAKITIGAVASVGLHGVRNRATFHNNSGGEISIDRTSTYGLWNYSSGTFTNAAKITIGAVESVGQYGIWNEATFDNNTDGDIRIDRSTDIGLVNVSGTFTNAAIITIGAIAGVGSQGIQNTDIFNNNSGGEIRIDRCSGIGLFNGGGTFTNAAKITIGAGATVGDEGIRNQSAFLNNSGGEIKIDRSSSSALMNQSGTFTNAAKITIGATDAVGTFGLWNQATFDNDNGSEIKIDRSSVFAMYNASGTFTNEAKIVIGATAGVGSHGIINFASFQSSTCTALIHIVANAIIENSGTFSNAGTIIENASGNSSITTNTGIVQNLNGGTFTTGGTAAITATGDIWTGCTSTDWATATNWFDGSVPTTTDDAVIPDVTNDPEISTAAVAKSVTVQSGAVLTIDDMGSLTINGSSSHGGFTAGLYNEGTVANSGDINIGSTADVGQRGIWNKATFNNNTDGEISIGQSTSVGLFNGSGTFTNAAKITIGAVESVGDYGIQNFATFNNSTGGEISIDRLYDTGLRNQNGTFTNAAKITIGAVASVGGLGLENQATFTNNSGGEIDINQSSIIGLRNGSGTFTNAAKITIGAEAGVGINGIQNFATFNNSTGGEISIDRCSQIGLWNKSGTFTNAAKITIGAVAGVGSNGIRNEATFNNSTCTALVHIVANAIIENTGTFDNAGGIIENATGNSSITTNTGVIQNLNGGTFTTGGTPATTFAGHLSACCPAANILYVNDDATGNNDGTSWTDAYTDLQSALNSPCPGITQIWVAEGTYKPTSGTDRTISFVMKNGVEILGGFPNTGDPGFGDRDPDPATNGTVLSGDIGGAGNGDNSYHVIFNNFTSGSPLTGTAVLDGFTITGGNANFDSELFNSGGGMCNLYASPTVTNCSFANNSAFKRGGGMYNVLSTPAVSYCSFSGNSAGSEGGGMLCYETPVGLSVTHCTFSNNTADNNGGGLNIRSSRTTAPSVTHCTFSGNSVTSNTDSRGGGMYNDSTNTVIEHCTFSGNSASGDGGGLVGGYDFAGARYCSFLGNSAAANGGGAYERLGFNSGFSNCVFVGNTAATGGGLYTRSSTTNCSFSGNSATNGGAISVPGGNFSPIKNCILWGNSSEVHTQFNAANVTYSIVQGGYAGTGNLNTDPLFVDQPTIGLGTSGDLHLQSCSPAKNTGTATDAPADDFDGDSRPQGIGIDMGYDESTSPECCPAGNILYVNDDATGANSGLSWTDAFTDLQSALNSTCPGVTQIWVAEGTYKPTSGTDRSISFVMKNGVEILGGFPNTGDPDLNDRNPDPATNGTVLSGDINTAAATDNSYHVIFNNFTSGSPLTGTAVLDGFTVTGGYASDVAPHCHGGGMYNLYASPTVTNCIFSNNTARRSAATSFDSRGGGMYNSYSAPSVSYCTFSNNEARAVNSSGVSRGGGMFNEHATMTISNCTFSNNTTPNSDEDTYGGGMCNLNMTIEITDCEFSGNAACFGGGVYHEASAITVNNCTFSGNSLDTYPGGVNGSGMYVSGSSGSVSQCTFTGNLNHAALGIQYGTPIEVSHCTFLNNPVYGMTLQSAAPILTNCLFAGNAFGGLAIWQGDNSSPTLTNCTFSENPVYVNLGAITNYSTSTATLKNCILWGDGPSVHNPSGTVNISYSIVKQPAGVYPGTGNLNVDPLFVGATDFHLQACSPAIDAGTDAGAPADDLDGNARPFDAAPNVAGNFDMGAYEYQELLPAPTATCQDITVQLDANGSVTVSAADVSDNSTGCGVLAFLINGETSLTYTCDDLGNHTVTLTVTDAFDNTDDCEATITVADDDNPCCAAPEAFCTSYTAVLGPGGTATVAPANVNDGSTYECGLQSMTVSPDQFDCSDLGPQTVTLTVTDINGASDQCLATVNVVDNSLPSITCPGPVTVTCSGNVPAVNLAAVTASDNCGAPTKSHVGDATSNQTCANRKTVTRTYRATDGSGNSTTCAQVITVYDDVKPNFTSVPANVTVQCNSVPAVGTATATDGCGGTVTIAYNGQTIANGACFDAYTITRQWTATDACGNTKTATQRITVVDTQKPNFTGTPANITVQCSAIPDPATPAATDNCDATVAITYNGQTQTNGACPNAYTLTRRWTAADNCGNTRSISQRIVVVDNGKPVFTSFPENTTIACDETPPAVGSPMASDGCGNATVMYFGQSSTGGSCPGNYQLKRTWRATDACGNSTVATQTIQVSDTEAPVFTSTPGPLTIECSDPLPPLVNPTATDACGGYVHITFLGNEASGSGCAADYTVTRTWQAADLCGNTTTTTQVITVLGNSYGGEGAENRAEATPLKTQNSKLVTVNPNPTTDRIMLDLADYAGEAITVSIFSDLGQLIWERRILVVEALNVSVSLREAGAVPGLYTVRVRSQSGVEAKRVLLVERGN